MTDLATNPVACQSIPANAADVRALITGAFSGTGLAYVGSAAETVVQSLTPAMSVLINPFVLIMDHTGNSNLTSRRVCVYSDVAVTVTLASAPSSGTRTDLIVARVYDTFFSGASDKATVEVASGSVPAGAFLLATVTVGTSVTSIVDADIANTAARATASGGVLPVPTQALLPDASAVGVGSLAMTLDYNGMWVSNGASWVLQSEPARFLQLGSDFSTTNTTQTASPLSITLAPNGLYEVRGALFVAAPAASDVNWAFTLPAGASAARLGVQGPGAGTTGVHNSTVARMQGYPATTFTNIGTDGTSDSYAEVAMVVQMGATAGALGIGIGLGAGTGTATLRSGSFLSATRRG